MIGMFFNLNAIVFVIAVNLICLLIFMKKKNRFGVATKLSFMIVFTITMLFQVYILANLQDVSKIGPGLSFIILSNAYMGIIKSVEVLASNLTNKE